MTNKKLKYVILLDISQLIKKRFSTGIQRVVKEFIYFSFANNLNIKIIYFDIIKNKYFKMSFLEIESFLADVKNYEITFNKTLNISNLNYQKKIFLELDSVWNEEKNPRIDLYKRLKSYNFTIINYIYDLIPVKFPDYMRDNTKKNFIPYINAINLYSDKVLFDSYSAQNDYFELFPFQKKEIETDVIYLGADYKLKKTLKKNNYPFIDDKYILFVGTFEPRKRQDLILNSFNILKKKYHDLKLVYVGSIGWDSEKILEDIYSSNLFNKDLFLFDELDDENLNYLYQNSYIITYLSNYEGFGLPVAEGLYHNKLVIASCNSSLKEVGKNFVEYINNNKISEIVEIIDYYLSNNQEYINKINFIKSNYKKLTWYDFYNNLLKCLEI